VEDQILLLAVLVAVVQEVLVAELRQPQTLVEAVVGDMVLAVDQVVQASSSFPTLTPITHHQH